MMSEVMRQVTGARFLTMVELLDQRLASMDENPWKSVDLSKLSDDELANAVEALRELLYSPPTRGK